MKKYVGLSLSFCIKAILSGDIKADQVAFIVPGFDLKNWDFAFDHYMEIYWRRWPKETVVELLNKVDIRNLSPKGHNIARGCWYPLDQWEPEILGDHEKRLHLHELDLSE